MEIIPENSIFYDRLLYERAPYTELYLRSLDTVLRLETVNNKTQIVNSHLSKHMAYKSFIHQKLAIMDNAKFNILMADLIIVMRNVSHVCDPTELKWYTQHFVLRIQFTG